MAQPRIDGYGNQFRSRASGIPPNAGNHVPGEPAAAGGDQEEGAAASQIICKQLAIIGFAAEAGGFDLQNPVQIGSKREPDGEMPFHSVLLIVAGFSGSCNRVARKRYPARRGHLDKNLGGGHTDYVLQLSGNKPRVETTLVDLSRGEAAVLEGIDLPADEARRLMELGFLPGTRITAGRSAPGGDPRVFQVDGSEIALRRETARHLTVQIEKKRSA